MNHYRLSKCTCDRNKLCNTDDFIFYHNINFYLLSINFCQSHYSIDFKQSLINSIIDSESNTNVYKIYDRNGRTPLSDSFKEFRLRNLNLNRAILEVNYIYDAFAREEMCVTSVVKYINLAMRQDELKANYLEAKIYLEKNGYKHLLEGSNSLDKLFEYNTIYEGRNLKLQTLKSIDKLTKTIKDEINRKSKH